MDGKDNVDLVQNFIRQFISTDRLHRKEIEKMVSEIGIHRSQHYVLMRISKSKTPVSQKELADGLEISPAALAVTLRKLEAGGYIERRTGEADGRRNEVSLTERGREVIRLSRERFRTVDEQMCRGIPEKELSAFISCLEKMQENLKN